jgi:hypothetical protein
MANEHNPIRHVEELPKFRLFHTPPSPEPGLALVLFKKGGSLTTYWPTDRLSAGEVRWGNYTIAYKVDLTDHSFAFSCTLPCEGDAFEFNADVNVTYAVSEPKVIVERNVTDVMALIEPIITDIMREVSRKFDVEDSAAAEKAIGLKLNGLRLDEGVKIKRLVAKLGLEEDARDHLRKMRELDRNKIRDKKEAEVIQQREKLEIERLKIKMDFYSPLIAQGQWQLLALQLSNNPDDAVAIAQIISQERQLNIKNQLEALKIMVEEDALEGFQLEEPAKKVLRRFVESLDLDQTPRALGKGGDQENNVEEDVLVDEGRGSKSIDHEEDEKD